MKFLVVLAFLSTPDLPPGIDCNLVRQYVSEHGKAKALAWAIREGYSWAQIREAKRCLK